MNSTLAIVLISLSGVPALLFCILYTYYARWWRIPEGRHMFLLTAGIAGFAIVSVTRRIYGVWPHYEHTVIGLYLFVAWQLWQRVRLLWRANHVDPERLGAPYVIKEHGKRKGEA